MRELVILAIHLLVTFVKLLRRGGVDTVAAESLLLKHQLLISNRSGKRAPSLTTLDRLVLGLTTLFVNPRRIAKLGALVKPVTLLKFHKALVDRKYHLLFSSSSHRRKPGPKRPSAKFIAAIIELKRRKPKLGCVRIAQQISHAFGVGIDKDVVRRVLAKHYLPGNSRTSGPCWLTFVGHVKDGLWSVDLFRCESILLRSHWVMLVMDVFTRRLIGFGVEPGPIDGVSVCRMFDHAIAGQPPPKHVMLGGSIAVACFRPHWQPECEFATHTPERRASAPFPTPGNFVSYVWKQHCRGLFETADRRLTDSSPPTSRDASFCGYGLFAIP